MKLRWHSWLGLVGVLLLLGGSYYGLTGAPEELYQRAPQRIMYVHVPTAWTALLTFTATFVASVQWLRTRAPKWDHLVEASIEAGVVLGCLLSAQGSIWARPIWNVWWDWDPRLTSVAVMVLSYAGIAALRSFVDDPERRATWSSVASITAYANVIFVYLCVKWLRTLHQPHSSPDTVDPGMVLALRFNAVAMLFIGIALVALRWRIAKRRYEREMEA